jgi:hypothetical protein
MFSLGTKMFLPRIIAFLNGIDSFRLRMNKFASGMNIFPVGAVKFFTILRAGIWRRLACGINQNSPLERTGKLCQAILKPWPIPRTPC